MKVLFVVLLVFSKFCFAQKTDVFRIDSLPPQGILLDKGWKWHAGDNPDFAKADFDDSAWKGIDPTKDIMELPQIANSKIGWLRLNISIDSSIFNKSLAILIKQTGASEIFLNGKKIHQFGKIFSLNTETEAYDPHGDPISLIFSNSKNQIIAVRFAPPPLFLVSYVNTSYHTLVLKISKIESIVAINHDLVRGAFSLDDHLLAIFKVGFFFILCFIHLSFFLLYKRNKSNLYFSIYSLLMVVSTGTTFYDYFNNLRVSNYFAIMGNIAIPLTAFFSMLAVQKLLNATKGKLFWTTAIVSFISIPLMLRPYKSGALIGGLFLYFLIVITIAIMTWKSYKLGKNGVLPIFIASLTFFVFYSLFLYFFSTKIDIPYRALITDVCFNVAVLALPLSVSYYLAAEFSNNNKTIEQNLADFKILSEEKQLILSTQNETLEKQVAERTTELRASQAQLIQKEKLASLGELTAGIAHEIQNPLNFVNNFSEVSVELANELSEALRQRGIEANSEEGELVSDLIQNQEKISHHGKRASSIVKSMLEHSRKSTGEKELSDINALADEYLRLGYHGLRAKDSTFNADFKTDFDENLPQIAVIQQDLGRVLLNLINNAFYASRSVKNPLVEIKTQKVENSVIVSIRDNGSGMSEATKAKIFQPFFTTKPTGEGTGLGLSLAYDIVTKGHGGAIEVHSTEGVGSEFVITLPIKTT